MNWHKLHEGSRTFGQELADKVALVMGSWKFIIIQSIIVILWMALNVVGWCYHWDVYPYILLNLVFSTQAAYASPIILMSANRAADRDRHNAEADYLINLNSKKDLELLISKLNSIEIEKIDIIMNEIKLIKETLKQTECSKNK